MANIKVSEMTEATVFDDGDYTMIVQGNQNKKISHENILGNIENNIANNTSNISQINTNITNYGQYSLQETFTGKTWIDGKPIYRKVINCGALPNNTTKNVTHNISNLSNVIFANGISYSSGTGNYFPIPYSADTLQAQVKMWVTNTDVSLQTLSDRSNYTTTYIILEYTKTTD